MKPIEVIGVSKVVSNLLKVKKNIGRGVERGFVKSAQFIRRESRFIVPRQIGTLHDKWDIRKHGSGLKVDVEFGYFGTEYGAFVHEVPGIDLSSPVTHGQLFNIKHAAEIAAAKGTPLGTAAGGMFRRRPQEQWKFLEKPIREHTTDILNIIKSEVMKLK
jgi:hypothetical protein